MDDRLLRLESTLEDLGSVVGELERRIAALESRPAVAAAEPEAAAPAAVAALDAGPSRGAQDWRDPITVLSLLGRLFIILGGGYLLRAMTESGAVPPAAGVALGFAYGLVWLIMSDRAAGQARWPHAAFDGIAAALVAFPVLLEATTRFKVLTGASGAAILAVLTAGMLLSAWRRRHQTLAWVAVVVALPTSIALVANTGVAVPYAFYLMLLGVATLWAGYELDWLFLRWPVAAVADIVVLGVTLRALSPEHQESTGMALTVQVALLGVYLASIAVRTLVRGRNVIPFEVAQTVAALVVGFGGAMAVTRATGTGVAALGMASLAFGVASYLVAFAFIDRQQQRGRNVYFYTSLAIVFVLAGTVRMVPAGPLTVALALLAVLSCGMWFRFGRLFLLLHGASYLLAANLVSGVLGYAASALAGQVAGGWSLPEGADVAVLVAAAACAWLGAAESPSPSSRFARLPRFIIVLLFVWAAGGVVIGYLAPAVAGRPDRTIDAGVLATIRTAVLALSTLVVAWVGRHARFREWSWLVYPLLVGIGVKMVAEDFMRSRPATLFVALGLYGVALILAPRMRHDRSGSDTAD